MQAAPLKGEAVTLTADQKDFIRMVAREAAFEAIEQRAKVDRDAQRQRELAASKAIADAIALHQATCTTGRTFSADRNQRKGRASLWQWMVSLGTLGAVIASAIAAVAALQ